MKNSPFLKTLVLTCWLPFVLLVVGVHWESLQITGKKPQYIALGKIALNQLHIAVASAGEAAFFDQQIQILKGNEVKARTLKRVHGLHPETQASEVKIAVTRAEGSFILKVAAIGEEQKYVRLYLDALLDEYQAYFGETLAKDPSSGAMGCLIIMERPETALLDPPDLVGPLILGGGAGLMAGAVLMLVLAAAASAWVGRSHMEIGSLLD